MTHYASIGEIHEGWGWPLSEECPRALKPIVSSLNQATDYIRRAGDGLPEEFLWKRLGKDVPSIGNILMHLRGTEHQWIGNKLGGRPFERNRPEEFSTSGGGTLAELLCAMNETRKESHEIISSLSSADVERDDYDGRFSAQFILHYAAQHFAWHAAQIVMLRKILEPGFSLY